MGNYPFVITQGVQDAPASTQPAAHAALNFKTISSEAGFAELRGSWDALVRAMPRPSPFLLHGWLTEWWRHYGEGCKLALETAFRGDRLVAALPLITYRRHGLTVSTFLGGRQSAPADVLLARDEHPPIAAALIERAASAHDYADLFGLPFDCRMTSVCDRSALRLFQRIEAPVLDLSQGWEATYMAKTNARRRAHHRRRRRQLAELGKVEVGFARTLSELEPALEEAFRLHELRWRGRSDGSGFVTPTGMRFSRAALRALASIDAARIVTLVIDGRAIAFLWYIALERRMFLHRIGFDPAFARCSPGLINTLNALELAGAEGVRRVEFLGGAERYKVELADRFEPLCLGLGLTGSTPGEIVVAARTRWLACREVAKHSNTTRKLYDLAEPVRRRLTHPRDVLRPDGLRRPLD
jgi:CelD/BcsL family acetyltransferase involved in cellulose biosynthesis